MSEAKKNGNDKGKIVANMECYKNQTLFQNTNKLNMINDIFFLASKFVICQQNKDVIFRKGNLVFLELVACQLLLFNSKEMNKNHCQKATKSQCINYFLSEDYSVCEMLER